MTRVTQNEFIEVLFEIAYILWCWTFIIEKLNIFTINSSTCAGVTGQPTLDLAIGYPKQVRLFKNISQLIDSCTSGLFYIFPWLKNKHTKFNGGIESKKKLKINKLVKSILSSIIFHWWELVVTSKSLDHRYWITLSKWYGAINVWHYTQTSLLTYVFSFLLCD